MMFVLKWRLLTRRNRAEQGMQQLEQVTFNYVHVGPTNAAFRALNEVARHSRRSKAKHSQASGMVVAYDNDHKA